MSLKTILVAIGTWVAGAFKSIKNDGAKIAIGITEGVKKAITSGALPALAEILDHIVGGHLAEDAVNLLKNNINKILASELAIQGLPDNPTEADIEAFGNAVIKAFTGLDAQGKSKLYTVLSAQIYGIIKKEDNLTFATLVVDIEEAYQDYLTDVANENAASLTA